MNKGKGKSKKPAKQVRNVLVQPFDVIWPSIEGEDFNDCTRYLQQVERKNIVIGCNAVIKLLQNGQAAAFFLHNSFHPKVFAKIIIRMARKRDASVLILALPSLPKPASKSQMMAIVRQKEDTQQSSAVKNLLSWMVDLLVEKKFVSAKDLRRKPVAKQVKKIVDKQPDEPMTEEQVSKLYVLEPISDGCALNDRRNELGDADFISFSESDSHVTVQNKPTNTTAVQQLVKQRKKTVEPYLPLTINRVQTNANRVKHKKKSKRT